MNSGRLIVSLLSFLGLFSMPSAVKAWDFYDIVDSGSSVNVYGVDSSSGEKALLTTKTISGGWSSARTHVDGKRRLVIATGSDRLIYDPEADSCTDSTVFSGTAYGYSQDGAITTNASAISSNDTDISTNASAISSNDTDIATNASAISSNDTDISTNASAISSNDDDISSLQSLVKSSGSGVQIGSDSNGVTITSSAVKVGGENMIRKESDGSVHIGKNSLALKESGGRQQMWATDANGDSIDIDVTNGSRLLINGRDVEKSIDNVGALSAALGSVPAISADSQFTCGFGAGTHSSAYALSGGCASRVSDRVSVNAALATVINNHTGDSDDNLSARAGFTFRLGKIDNSPKVAARKAAELHDKVAKLEERNESLLALLQAQASRLERLEQLASGQLSLLGDRASSD